MGKDCGIRTERLAIENPGQVGAEGFKFCRLFHVDDAEWGGFGLVFVGEIPGGVVVLVALCVD